MLLLYFVIVILATWQCQHILCIHYWVELSLMLSSLLYIMLCQCYIFLYFPIFSYIFLYFLGWHPPAINSYIPTTSLACCHTQSSILIISSRSWQKNSREWGVLLSRHVARPALICWQQIFSEQKESIDIDCIVMELSSSRL